MLNLERLALALLHHLPPEQAHNLSIRLWQSCAHLTDFAQHLIAPPIIADACLQQHLAGLDFVHPLGIAAGYDKNAEIFHALMNMGLGHIEVGTITPKPQAGNPKPRLFRLPKDGAIINRMGFNGDGMVKIATNIAEHKILMPDKSRILGVNIGCNKDTTDIYDDYARVAQYCGDLGDYITVNVSSPNTPGLRQMQTQEHLQHIIHAVRVECANKPIFVKLAPDLSDDDFTILIESLCDMDINGVIISNTTLARPDDLYHHDIAHEQGGLSGQPLYGRATHLLKRAYVIAGGQLLLIGVGGIHSPQSAYDKITAGASLIQIYSAFAYHGIGLLRDIVAELPILLRQDGFTHIRQAVGSKAKK